ncbi:borealin [Diretmus argenteus]
MAPRKRATRQRKNLKNDKLEALLQDFDSEVKTMVERLKEKRNHLLNSAANAYDCALIKLPKAIRQRNWLEYCTSKKPAGAKSSSDDENTPNQNTVKKAKTKKKPPTTSKRAKALTVTKQNTSRTSKRPLVTPARSMMDSSLLMGPTPLITPRFDPRLPQTPALRGPRHKERLYSISVNGSPVAAGSEDVVINVPIGNGESIQLLASQMDSLDLSLLDESALRSIRLLQNRLTTLCGPSQ